MTSPAAASCSSLPFVTGGHDPLAVPLAAVAWALGRVGLLLELNRFHNRTGRLPVPELIGKRPAVTCEGKGPAGMGGPCGRASLGVRGDFLALDDALPSIVPSPEPRAVLQMHPAHPPIDAARRDPIEFAGQHRPAGIRERHAALQHATVFNGR